MTDNRLSTARQSSSAFTSSPPSDVTGEQQQQENEKIMDNFIGKIIGDITAKNITKDISDNDNYSEALDYWDYYMDTMGDNEPSPGEVIHQTVLPIICAFGIVGILLTIVVLSRKNMCTSTNCYLLALAMADLLFLVIFSTSLWIHYFHDGTQTHYNYVIFVSYAMIFASVFLVSSVWLTVMLAIERYIAICRPFYAPRVCTVQRARIIIVVIFAVSFIVRTPNFWEHKIVSVFDTINNKTVWFIQNTEFAESASYTAIYPWIVEVAFTTVLPFVLLIILNMYLILAVRQSTAYIKRHSMVSENANQIVQREELQITTMLISVVVVFLLCQSPYVIYTAIASTASFHIHNPNFMIFRYVTLMLLSIKAAVNFIVYCWFSEKFLETLKRLLLIHYCNKLPRDYSGLTSSRLESFRRRSSVLTRDTTIV